MSKELPVQLARFREGGVSDLLRDSRNLVMYAEPKIDGIRTWIRTSTGKALSRNGKPLYNLNHIKSEIKRFAPPGYIVDGELFLRDWNTTFSIVSSSKTKKNEKVIFYPFAIITEKEYKFRRGKTSYLKYKNILKKMFKNAKYIKVLDHIPVKRPNEAKAVEKLHKKSGYEGTVYKLNKPYKFTRVDWTKVKEFDTVDGVVVGVKEGTGRLKGSLGALQCLVKDKTVNVGTGFSDSARKAIYFAFKENPKSVLGRKIEIKFLSKTRNSLRHPVFVRFVELK